jgi:hypothetical protein
VVFDSEIFERCQFQAMNMKASKTLLKNVGWAKRQHAQQKRHYLAKEPT